MSQPHRAKKTLGQNFLKSKKVLQKIAETGGVALNDVVLEIGPGKGALTKILLEAGATVVAFEKDADLLPLLQEQFEKEIRAGKLIIYEQDILAADLDTIKQLQNGYKLIANIPYYITGAILEMFLSTNVQPQTATVLVQKEVAERIVARDNKESILSISVKAFGEPHYAGAVRRTLFSPAPNVDSAILHIDNISKNNFAEISEETFFTIVKAGFAHKRKQLGSNLSAILNADAVAQCNIEKTRRAESLTIEDWLCLTKRSQAQEGSSL